MKKVIFIVLFSSIYINTSFSQLLCKEDSLKIQDAFYYFDGNLPGATVCILSHGNEIFYKNFGLANYEKKEKITREHYFPIISIGKIYTTMAILKLVEQNKLSLDESLKDIFVDFPEYGKNIKVKNLLSHTSGLVSFDPSIINSNKELVKFLCSQDSIIIQTGSQWLYSNSDYPLLASIVELRSGTSFQRFLKKQVFKKMKISKKQFVDEFSKEKITLGYKEKTLNFTLINNPYHNIVGENGLLLTIDDLIKTENAVFYNKNNPVKNYNLVFEKFQTNSNFEINYGFGWYIVPQEKDKLEKSIYWIGGRSYGLQTVLVHFPEEKISVILLINRDQMFNSIVKMAVDIGKLALE